MTTTRWSFGPFEFDTRVYRLVRSGEPVAAQPKPLDLLARLLEAPGELLAREVLEAALYPDTTVSSTALRNVVLKLREALGPEHEGWVETVPRRGVRFVGPVTVARDVTPEAPALRSLYLPAERDRFVGRTTDREALAGALSEARLVSLLGPGGVGKTRLAIHHCWATVEAWPGGVWFCDLSDARSRDAVLSIVGSALDVPLGQGDPIARIGHAIATRGKCLVVLDNFEQLVRWAGELVGVWLDRAPEVHFLVTTRALLQLPGEHALDLMPLDVTDAEALFVERARAADPRWTAPAEPGVVAALVEMLDALPLAIELAASRVRVMSLSALALRMGERFELLKSSGGRPSRHATLRATLDDSWELLSGDERAALAQLSVFDGGFSLTAAEQVLDAGTGWRADLVQALVDKSLVRFVRNERSTGQPVDRFDLLATVREYAAERLAVRGAAAAESRHGEWFARFARDTVHRLDAEQRFGPELANLVVACRRAVDRGDEPCAAATLAAAWEVLDARGPFALGLALAEAVIERFGTGNGAVLFIRANAAGSLGRTAESMTGYEEALAAAEGGVDRVLVGRIHMQIAVVLLGSGRHDEARRALDAALPEIRSDASRRYEGTVLLLSGNLSRLIGDTAAARALYEQALEVAKSLGDLRVQRVALGNLAVVFHHGLGRLTEAREHYTEALACVRASGDRRMEGHVLGNLGALDQEEGRPIEAGAWYAASLAVHRQLGNRREEGGVLGNLGNWSRGLGRWAEAQTQYEAALEIHREVGNRREEGIVLHNLAVLWIERDPARAEAGLLAALAIHREVRNRRFEGYVFDAIGTLREQGGDQAGARAALSTSLTIQRETGNARDQALTLRRLGRIALAMGDHEAAARAGTEGIAIARAASDRRSLAGLLVLWAELEHAAGRVQEARTALAEAEALATGVEDGGLHESLLRVHTLLSG